LTQLCESKVIDHQLFHVESKPLEPAEAPLQIHPPHFFRLASMGGLLGAFFFLCALLIRAAFRGFPLSEEYLRDQKISFAGYVKKDYSETLRRISLAIEPHEVVALIGGSYGKDLAKLLAKGNRKVLRIEIGKETPLVHSQDHDHISIKHLQDREIPTKFTSWKKNYDCILIQSIAKLHSSRVIFCLKYADRFVLTLNEEKEEELKAFKEKKILCVLDR